MLLFLVAFNFCIIACLWLWCFAFLCLSLCLFILSLLGLIWGEGKYCVFVVVVVGFLFVCLKKKFLVCYCRSNLSDGEFPFVIVLILSDAGCLHGLALDIVKENM